MVILLLAFNGISEENLTQRKDEVNCERGDVGAKRKKGKRSSMRKPGSQEK